MTSTSDLPQSDTQPTEEPSRRRHRDIDPERIDLHRGMLSGLLAAIAMLTTIVALRTFTGVISFLDVLADALLLVLPISLFAKMLSLFGPQAKTLLLVGLMVVLLLIGTWIGRVFSRQTAGSRRIQWSRAFSWAIGLYAAMAIFTALFVTERSPDQAGGADILKVLGWLGVAAIVFAIVLGCSMMILRRQDPPPRWGWSRDPEVAAAEDAAYAVASAALDRRRLVTRIGYGVVSLVGVVVLGKEILRVANRKTVTGGPTGEMPPAITPNGDFYVISKNFTDPDPQRGDDWSIDIGGLVTTPLTLTRSDLEAIGTESFVSTLTCISNPIAGPLIGTANWTGVSLAAVLRKAGVGAGAVKLVAEGEDGYADSFPIERALAPEPHIVWEMNGEALHRLHGTPVRLIVPGLYGIKNVKWLTKLTVTRDDFQGYWQQRSWTDIAIIKTSSRIDVPGDHQVISSGATEIGGVAFAGDRGISKVEVSTDSGDTWQEATIVENPSPGGLSWVLWKLPWSPTAGAYRLVVRATDGMGQTQTEEGAPELPDGASGWHKITVGVA